MKTKLITSEYLNYYKSKQPISILKHFNKIKETVLNAESFGYNIAKSSVYSSMIEGNPIDFDSYLRYTNSGFNTKSKSFKEIQDLIYAYDFASKNSLTKKNILLAHKILSDNLLEEEKYRGNIRDKDAFADVTVKPVYCLTVFFGVIGNHPNNNAGIISRSISEQLTQMFVVG
jgi:hypothetical protein